MHWQEIVQTKTELSHLVSRSACLAVRRILGSHTYDVIAKLLEDIHEEFQLSKKTTATVTDSGSNFVKAFRLFSTEFERPELFSQPVVPTTIQDEDYSEEVSGFDSEVEANEGDLRQIQEEALLEDLEFFELTNMLDPANGICESFSLPPHRRCACHSLNLIATSDVGKIRDRTFIKLYRSTEAKLTAVWNKQSRSSNASDFIEKTLNKLFVVPNKTRWNSYYKSMERVRKLLVKNRTGMKKWFENRA